jgi:hypothetical protein
MRWPLFGIWLLFCSMMASAEFLTGFSLSLRHPKRLFEGASEWVIMLTSKRDYVSNLFLRQFVRIATALRDSLVMDEKHPLLGRVMIHVEKGFHDVDHELHRSFVII